MLGEAQEDHTSEAKAVIQRPPAHVRKGLRRLYILLTVPWLVISGYIAYTANLEARRSHGWAVVWMDEQAKVVRKLGHDAAMRQEDYTSRIEMHLDEYRAARQLRNRALMALPVVPLGLPLLWIAYLWVAAGFQKPASSDP